MADDKQGRDEQAHNAANRQRLQDMAEELERMHETEPPIDAKALDDVESELEPLSFPATGAEVVQAAGDRPIASPTETYAVADLVPESEEVAFDSPAAVRVRVQRPTIAAAMKRIEEAAAGHQNVDLRGSQREAYDTTLRSLKTIDADDEDEGIATVTDWIIERIEAKEGLPGSRAVRRQAAKFCRAEGHQIRSDEWLGV